MSADAICFRSAAGVSGGTDSFYRRVCIASLTGVLDRTRPAYLSTQPSIEEVQALLNIRQLPLVVITTSTDNLTVQSANQYVPIAFPS